ncbi:MAG: serine/threonine-protein kinase [Longimicrobiales bacterium]|nr:serine/threonine-protein kinase [Longimicrobiales bacterium]
MVDLIGLLNSELDGVYHVSAEIGRGGMAVVYLGEDLRHIRRVAIKVLLPELAAVVGTDRFRREIQLESRLNHPNILPLLDSGEVDGLPFYVMPYVTGESLADRLASEKQLPVEKVVRMGVEVADALAHAHQAGIVHRDIKPGNILLEAGHAVVADFGIALLTREVSAGRLTASGAAPGSPLYMSPEQAAGSEELDGRSDVYSLGCVLYEALTGDPPFTARMPQAILARKVTEPAPSARVVRDAVSEPLDRALRQALARNLGDRYPDAGAFRDALTEILEGRAPPGPSTVPGEGSQGSAPLPRWLRGVGVAAALVALITTLGFLTNRVHDLRLGIPPAHTPSRSDFLALGVQTLIPLLIFVAAAMTVYVAAHILVRAGGWVVHRTPRLGNTVDAAIRTLGGFWQRAWRRLRPATVADLYLLTVLAVGMLALFPYRGILEGMVLADTQGLADPWLRRSYPVVLSLVIATLLFTWRSVFRWLRRRTVLSGRVAFSRWGSLSLILLLLLVATLPWRILWDADAERVLVEGRPGYLLKETPSSLLVYDPEAGITVVHSRDNGLEVRRLGGRGNPFEGPEAFSSVNRGR